MSFHLQVVILTVALALHVKIIKEEGDIAVLWCFQEDGAVNIIGVDFRPARTLQIAIFLFICSATAWKKQSQSEHLQHQTRFYHIFFSLYSRRQLKLCILWIIQEEKIRECTFEEGLTRLIVPMWGKKKKKQKLHTYNAKDILWSSPGDK